MGGGGTVTCTVPDEVRGIRIRRVGFAIGLVARADASVQTTHDRVEICLCGEEQEAARDPQK